MQSRLCACPAKYLAQIALTQCDASFRGKMPGTRDVHEDRAAPTLHARFAVVIEYGYEIVQRVVTPHSFGARGVGVTNHAVVVSIAGRVAPSAVAFKGSDGQSRQWPHHAVCTVEDFDNLPSANRSCAISFAFSRAAPGVAKGTSQVDLAQDDPTLSALSGSPNNGYILKKGHFERCQLPRMFHPKRRVGFQRTRL